MIHIKQDSNIARKLLLTQEWLSRCDGVRKIQL